MRSLPVLVLLVAAGCGAHTIISLDVTATREVDDHVTVHAVVACDTMNAAHDCLDAGDYCLVATWRDATAVVDSIRLCRTTALSSDGARDAFDLASSVVIPAPPGIDLEAALEAPDGAPLAYDYGDQDVTIPSP